MTASFSAVMPRPNIRLCLCMAHLALTASTNPAVGAESKVGSRGRADSISLVRRIAPEFGASSLVSMEVSASAAQPETFRLEPLPAEVHDTNVLSAQQRLIRSQQRREEPMQTLTVDADGSALAGFATQQRELLAQRPPPGSAGMPVGGQSGEYVPADDIPSEKKTSVQGRPMMALGIIAAIVVLCVVSDMFYRSPTPAAARRSTARASGDASAEGAEGAGGAEDAGGAEGEGTAASDAVSDQSDNEDLTTDGLPEDTYGLAIASIMHDLQHLAKDGGSKHDWLRRLRLLSSSLLVFVNIAVQIAMIYFIMQYSAAKAVQDVRTGYDAYEKHMYDGRVFLTEFGNARGLSDKHFIPTNFQTLADDVKSVVCRIPLSQPAFLGLILMIWSLSVVGELRESINLFTRLMATGTADSMKEAVEVHDSEEVIMRMTCCVKSCIFLFVLLPRLLIAMVLLWLGCRWLAATADFQNLVLNGVGLEFVLNLRCLMYTALVPQRSHRDVQRMRIVIAAEGGEPTPVSLLGSFVWGAVAVAWVYSYIYVLQSVLPYYGWDVQETCLPWMKEHYASMF
eukprot:TRINITY_DN12771_c0_g1_i1.p1 TRINITY_DN12771_c0_g1~~TRINITY_DN12771_c0_g1_i1.p1  ORF type:complete len:568 (+),score=86.20 TRINITY_DN12771_c0_g1_i1:331-2034(+)